MTNPIGSGIYALSDATRLVQADLRTVRRWLHGYRWYRKGVVHWSPPLWQTEYSKDDFAPDVIGFLDLLELRIVVSLVSKGINVSVVRAAADSARQEFGVSHALTATKFLTDGKRIFYDTLQREDVRAEMAQEGQLLDMAKQQFVFDAVVRSSLYDAVEYDNNDMARRWFPMGPSKKIVLLDPRLQFGAPIIAEAAIPTDTLYAAYLAEGNDRGAVARIYDIPRVSVDAAVRFEEKLAA
ncbi:MAG: DUF433 domain-containing protein [Caldimonas sp.]